MKGRNRRIGIEGFQPAYMLDLSFIQEMQEVFVCWKWVAEHPGASVRYPLCCPLLRWHVDVIVVIESLLLCYLTRWGELTLVRLFSDVCATVSCSELDDLCAKALSLRLRSLSLFHRGKQTCRIQRKLETVVQPRITIMPKRFTRLERVRQAKSVGGASSQPETHQR